MWKPPRCTVRKHSAVIACGGTMCVAALVISKPIEPWTRSLWLCPWAWTTYSISDPVHVKLEWAYKAYRLSVAAAVCVHCFDIGWHPIYPPCLLPDRITPSAQRRLCQTVLVKIPHSALSYCGLCWGLHSLSNDKQMRAVIIGFSMLALHSVCLPVRSRKFFPLYFLFPIIGECG